MKQANKITRQKMSKSLDELLTQLSQTPPTCISGFVSSPTELPEPWDDNPRSVWQLACRCGSKVGRLLGYPLKDYNNEYEGPMIFLSPLGFECCECGMVTDVLDTDIHGYHAEVSRLEGSDCGSAKLRGEGLRQAFRCPSCDADSFAMTVGFVFWYVDELLEEFDDKWENLFNVFLCHCKCSKCGQWSQPTEFGKL
jgi:hypothetical protein